MHAANTLPCVLLTTLSCTYISHTVGPTYGCMITTEVNGLTNFMVVGLVMCSRMEQPVCSVMFDSDTNSIHSISTSLM